MPPMMPKNQGKEIRSQLPSTEKVHIKVGWHPRRVYIRGGRSLNKNYFSTFLSESLECFNKKFFLNFLEKFSRIEDSPKDIWPYVKVEISLIGVENGFWQEKGKGM